MKILIASIILGVTFPLNAYESIGDKSNRQAYESQKGYAYEKNCFRYEYSEQYIPGNSISPGYVKSYREKVSIPCNNHRNVLNHHYHEPEPSTSYLKNQSPPKCTTNTMLGGLIGGGNPTTSDVQFRFSNFRFPNFVFKSSFSIFRIQNLISIFKK